ncbi:MAG: flagellar biosynthetic protein FliR [candidate division FCPU426 bacterium]
MDLAQASMEQAQAFILILVRVGALFMAAPILGNARIPGQVKAGLILLVSVLLLFSLNTQGLNLPQKAVGNIFALTGSIMGELFVGLAVAYSSFLFFSAIQMAGQILDIQVGFGLVNVLDPTSNSQVSVLGQFYYLVALLYFLALDGHHFLLKALGDSFRLIPPGSLGWFEHAAAAGPKLSDFFTQLFIIALQIAGPSIAVLFLTNVTMGLLSRTIPQMNVFIVGLPANVLIGLLVTIVSLKFMGTVLHSVINSMGDGIARLLHTLAA